MNNSKTIIKFVTYFIVFMFSLSMLIFAACDKDTSVENENTSHSQQHKTVRLDETNYAKFLDIDITPISQSNTFKYNTYYVQYSYSSTPHTINSPTPPTGNNITTCIYLSSTYTVLTTITVTTKTKSPDYIFSDVYLRWKDFPTSISGFTDFVINSEGAFTKTYNIYEDITSPYKIIQCQIFC